jgi:hypothetical protein
VRARLVSAAAAAALPAILALGAAPAIADPGGNNGTIKLAEVDQVGTDSNDPHVGCTFALEWYGFDAGATSVVTFESQDHDVTLTGVHGDTTVELEDDAAKGGSDLDHREIYTLSFAGDPHPVQGYHVKVTTDTEGAQGADSKSKTFWVGPCEAGDPATPTDPEDPTQTGPGSTVPFTWDWRYAAPTCSGLTVAYPADIPSGQANDVNVRVETDHGQVTLNFHNNTGTWGGTTSFVFTSHPSWPAGLASYDVTWVQVAGTNYHWQGDVSCATDGDPLTPDVPQALTEVSGFRAGTLSVARGATVPADSIQVEEAGTDEVTLERYAAGTWQVARTVRATERGTARITFPRFTHRGTYTYRLTVSQTMSTTGDTTGTLTVRVR